MIAEIEDHVVGVPVDNVQGQAVSVPGVGSPYLHLKQGKRRSIVRRMTKLGSYVHGIRAHVSLGPNISDTVKGKLNMGARILQAGGVDRVFRQSFSVREGEKLVKAMICYLSTTAGPIAGMLFISTENIAFLSDRSLTLTSSKGELARFSYKVLIPLTRINRIIKSENSRKRNQKYVQITTVDEFEFWFMGFLRYQKFFEYLQQSVSEPQ